MSDVETFTPRWAEYESAAGGYIKDTYELLTDLGQRQLDLANSALVDLDAFVGSGTPEQPVDYLPVDIAALAGPGEVPAVEMPTDPSAVRPIYTPASTTVYSPTFGSVPSSNLTAPSISEPLEPGGAPTFTESAPSIPYRDVPDAPALNLPAVPTFNTVTPVTITPLALPSWAETLPDFFVRTPNAEINFTEEAYSSAVLTAVQTKVLNALTGVDRIGLPQAVWDEIKAAAIAEADATEARAVETAQEEWYSRGWEMPAGPLTRTTQRARFEANKIRSAIIRELFVKRAQDELDALKFYTTQAVALEQILIAAHTARMERALRYAEAVAKLALDLMNAELAVYNGRLQAYIASADVYGKIIQAELAKLEEKKFELENNRFLLEQDKNAVAIYVARIDAATKVLQAYETQMRGVMAQVEMDRTQVQLYGEKAQVFNTLVGAWREQWNGYSAAWQGQLAKAQVFTAQVGGATAQVQAYTETVKAEIAKVEASGKVAEIEIEKLKADAQRYAAEIDGQAKLYAAKVEGAKLPFLAYNATAEYWSSLSRAYEAQLNASVEQAKAQAQIANDGVRLAIAQMDSERQVGLEVSKTKATVSMQAAASIFQGLNANVSMQDSNSHSQSVSATGAVGWSYSKDVNSAP